MRGAARPWMVDPDCRLYVTWFVAGLRIIDIMDPKRPVERGFFIPKPADGKDVPWTNDVARDDRGIFWLTDTVHGLDAIEFNGQIVGRISASVIRRSCAFLGGLRYR